MASYKDTYEDINGKNHRLYTVRVIDHDGYSNPRFGILDVYRNIFLGGYGMETREECWESLGRPKKDKAEEVVA